MVKKKTYFFYVYFLFQQKYFHPQEYLIKKEIINYILKEKYYFIYDLINQLYLFRFYFILLLLI